MKEYFSEHDFLRNRLYNQAGIVAHVPHRILPFDAVKIQMDRRLAWIFQACKNRLIQAHYRYGDNDSKVVVSFVKDIERCLNNYIKTGNIEFLIDGMNYMELEINYAQNPKKHFKSLDDSEHSQDSLHAPSI